jgi:glyoxylase-like metal-dependent hydrolase (beta-lactamase superfamily II)
MWMTWMTVLLAGAGAAAETVAGLPLHIQKPAPNAVRVWIGDYISSTATVAVATGKGIVVVDTLGIPRVDAELRKIIARELGRGDFKVLINTHEHGDHTGGNAVYADCAIVGHERVAAGMTAGPGDRQRQMDWYKTRFADLKADLEKEAAGSPSARRLQEDLALDRLNFEVLQADAKPVPPAQTFNDRMTLNMGDTTFELYYIGGMHSASDIAVFVPEAGLLMTGDTMADVWLTDTPGCLQSFIAREGVRHDFPLLLENWGLLLQKKEKIKKFLPGHWNGELSVKGFEDRVNYVRALWEGIQKAAREGKTLEAVQTEYALNTRFPELAGSPGFSERNTYATLMEMWTAATHQESAAARLYTLIDSGAGEDAVREVLAARDARPPKYYYLEFQLNAYGYRLLQENKVPQAVRLFKINADLYPDSWNVYDSLGEALLKSGDGSGAERMYAKSVELKPDNQNGINELKKIRGAAKSK